MGYVGYAIVDKDGFLMGGGKIATIYRKDTATGSSGNGRRPVPMPYEDLVSSLLRGVAFAFQTEDVHANFLKRVRNDPKHKNMLEISQNPRKVQWMERPEPKPVEPNKAKIDDGMPIPGPMQQVLAASSSPMYSSDLMREVAKAHER
jgi:hypothetical protein